MNESAAGLVVGGTAADTGGGAARQPSVGAARIVLWRLLTLIPLALLAALLPHYPFWPLEATLALAAYAALLWWRPALWLLLVPAALPWLDLGTRTGWFYLDEFDLMLLATAAVGYWRLAPCHRTGKLPTVAKLLLAAVAASTAVAAVRGLLPLPPLDLNAFASYSSHYNSLRVAKGLAWALVLLPLLTRSVGPELRGLRTLLVPGMLLGLFCTALVQGWERWLFPGLLNFSTDYRPTASFSAMHTGGAALDAFLALSFPFVACWLLGKSRPWQLGAALALLMMGLFTGFTTFSRDVWLAYAGSGVVIGCLVCGPQLAAGKLRPGVLVAVAALLAVISVLLMRSFATGGYRTLGGLLLLLGATLMTGGLPRAAGRVLQPRHLSWAGAATAALLLLDLALFVLLRNLPVPGWAKAPYLSLAAAAFGAGLAGAAALCGPRAWRQPATALALGAYPALAIACLLVARHWGGMPAAQDASWVVALSGLICITSLLFHQPLWRIGRASVTFGAGAAALLAMAIPVLGSSYMGERMSTVAQDWELRTRHWDEAVHMMPDDLPTTLLGAGLGSYPRTYYWGNMLGIRPGSFRYETDLVGNNFLRLAAPVHPRGYSDVVRHIQHVRLEPNTNYRIALDVKRSDPKAVVWMAVCERWLLYPQTCVSPVIKLAGADDRWQHFDLDFYSAGMGQRQDLLAQLAGARAPVQLELASGDQAGVVDIDNVSVRARNGGPELLRNGDFTAGQAGWFFTSDRDHLPWHIKNFYIHTYFEQGWLGAVALGLLLVYGAGRMAGSAWHGRVDAAVFLAALTGALVVGMFDSLFDVPKVQLLFFLVLAAGLLRPRRRLAGRPGTP
ncbi:hypothetical protein SAMN05428959_103445 [Duganella sp. CF517]|uniref:hypothetical protein n=1 Tax=Duganella sp. CF517 TaxID=1881038 RepID=UPI0008D85D53|nr:hypothetical protein [Duganella sp. CF517]SEN85667.1 hypothetical protein SAMN05428959_103445 [Duganella sp. CF517]